MLRFLLLFPQMSALQATVSRLKLDLEQEIREAAKADQRGRELRLELSTAQTSHKEYMELVRSLPLPHRHSVNHANTLERYHQSAVCSSWLSTVERWRPRGVSRPVCSSAWSSWQRRGRLRRSESDRWAQIYRERTMRAGALRRR